MRKPAEKTISLPLQMLPTTKPFERSPTTPVPHVRARWIVNQRYDLLFFIGSSVLTLVFWGVYQVAEKFGGLFRTDAVLITYFLFTAFFDHPHIFQTFSRTHFDPIEFRQHQWIHTWGLISLILIGFVIVGVGKEAELIVLTSVLGSYHIIRQHYGFLKAYKNLNCDRHRLDDQIDFGLFYTGMFACFFNDYTEAGTVVIYQQLQVNFPALPPILPELLWGLFILFLVAFVGRQIQRLFQRQPINLPKILLLMAVLSTHYFVYYATATPFLVAEALETAYHNVQYQGWIRHYQSQRFPNAAGIVNKWLMAAIAYGAIVGVIEIFGLVDRGWGLWLFVPFSMIVVYHYGVDGMIWQFSRQPELRPLFWLPTKASMSSNQP